MWVSSSIEANATDLAAVSKAACATLQLDSRSALGDAECLAWDRLRRNLSRPHESAATPPLRT
jgi:hypothetical protein